MDSYASQGTYSKDTQGRYVGSVAGESLCVRGTQARQGRRLCSVGRAANVGQPGKANRVTGAHRRAISVTG